MVQNENFLISIVILKTERWFGKGRAPLLEVIKQKMDTQTLLQETPGETVGPADLPGAVVEMLRDHALLEL